MHKSGLLDLKGLLMINFKNDYQITVQVYKYYAKLKIIITNIILHYKTKIVFS